MQCHLVNYNVHAIKLTQATFSLILQDSDIGIDASSILIKSDISLCNPKNAIMTGKMKDHRLAYS